MAQIADPFATLAASATGQRAPLPVHLVAPAQPKPRSFTEADQSLIRKVHAYMPAAQLLELLNVRLQADLGTRAVPYTADQLRAAVQTLGSAARTQGRDWPGLRKLLATARRDGVLQLVDEPLIDAFAVVCQLNAKQVLELKDILLRAKGE